MTMNFQLSRHCVNDRLDRLTFIMTHTGLGDTVCEYYNTQEDTLYRLTTTGVVMVLNGNGTLLVTAYYVQKPKAYAIFQLCESATMPYNRYVEIVKKNEKKYAKFGIFD